MCAIDRRRPEEPSPITLHLPLPPAVDEEVIQSTKVSYEEQNVTAVAAAAPAAAVEAQGSAPQQYQESDAFIQEIQSLIAKGSIDKSKVQAWINTVEQFNAAFDGRDVSYGGLAMIKSLFPYLPASTTKTEGRKMLLWDRMDEYACYIISRGGSGAESITCSEAMKQLFVSSQEMQDLTKQASMTSVAMWSRFLTEESVPHVMKAIAQLFFSPEYNEESINIVVQAETRMGIKMKCLCRLGYEVSPSLNETNLVLQLEIKTGQAPPNVPLGPLSFPIVDDDQPFKVWEEQHAAEMVGDDSFSSSFACSSATHARPTRSRLSRRAKHNKRSLAEHDEEEDEEEEEGEENDSISEGGGGRRRRRGENDDGDAKSRSSSTSKNKKKRCVGKTAATAAAVQKGSSRGGGGATSSTHHQKKQKQQHRQQHKKKAHHQHHHPSSSFAMAVKKEEEGGQQQQQKRNSFADCRSLSICSTSSNSSSSSSSTASAGVSPSSNASATTTAFWGENDTAAVGGGGRRNGNMMMMMSSSNNMMTLPPFPCFDDDSHMSDGMTGGEECGRSDGTCTPPLMASSWHHHQHHHQQQQQQPADGYLPILPQAQQMMMNHVPHLRMQDIGPNLLPSASCISTTSRNSAMASFPFLDGGASGPTVSGPFPRPAVLPPLNNMMEEDDHHDDNDVIKPSLVPLPCEGDDDLWEMIGQALCDDENGLGPDESSWLQQCLE